MFSFKVMLISTSVLSAAIMLKFSVPAVADFAVSEVPSIYNGVVSWLRPPYLYLVINFIIITIVASSKLQPSKSKEVVFDVPHLQPLDAIGGDVVQPPVMSVRTDDEYCNNGVVLNDESDLKEGKGLEFDVYEQGVGDASTRSVAGAPFADVASAAVEDVLSNKENEHVQATKSTWPEVSKGATEYSPLKPPVSARFGNRRNVKASPEGGKSVLRVAKPKRQDTLESTWKTITEGRAVPLTRHLRKSDTWERDNHLHGISRHQQQQEATPPPKTMTKSETFKDRTNTGSPTPGSSGGSGELKREPSLSQDELNRRVEAFIKKFNEEMRLQRQESLNQYVEMINRGSH